MISTCEVRREQAHADDGGLQSTEMKGQEWSGCAERAKGAAVMSSKYMAHCTDEGRQLSSLPVWDEPREKG